MNRRALLKTLTGLGLVSIPLTLQLRSRERGPEGSVRVQRGLMGTVWTIEAVHHGEPRRAAQAIEAAYAELTRIDLLMSDYKPQSPLSAINRAAGGEFVEVPAELVQIIRRGIAVSAATEGAFDITWRGMGKIWDWASDDFKPPTPEVVAAARSRINYRNIQVSGNRVRLATSGMSIGLGAIAKGYAIDRASAILRNAGFAGTMVVGGCDMRLSGTHGGDDWRLGIQHPRGERGQLLGRVRLRDAALVSSGDYERFRIVNGVRYHHIIDPRTGYPSTPCQAVSVIAPTAEEANVWAMSMFVLGPEKGLALARSRRVEAFLIDAGGRRHATPGFLERFEETERNLYDR